MERERRRKRENERRIRKKRIETKSFTHKIFAFMVIETHIFIYL